MAPATGEEAAPKVQKTDLTAQAKATAKSSAAPSQVTETPLSQGTEPFLFGPAPGAEAADFVNHVTATLLGLTSPAHCCVW